MTFKERFKSSTISLLKALDRMPLFQRLFNLIYKIKEIKPKNFLAAYLEQGFLLGSYNPIDSPLWQRIAYHNDFENNEIEILLKILPLTSLFVDVGAHIGYYSCFVGTHSNNKIIAFEPNPINHRSLLKNLEINGIKNMSVINKGLSSIPGSITLYGSDGEGSVVEESFKTVPSTQTQVEVTTLDSYLDVIPEEASWILKIDVEAGEYNVLKGAEKIFSMNPPTFILIEIVKHWSGKVNPNFSATFNCLKKYEYRIFEISEEQSSLNEIENIEQSEGGNYLFVNKNISKDLYESLASSRN